MSFAKPATKREDNFDDVQRLKCSVSGCSNRWAVHMDGDKPKCSKHQWNKPQTKTVAKSWHEVGEEF